MKIPEDSERKGEREKREINRVRVRRDRNRDDERDMERKGGKDELRGKELQRVDRR